MNSQMLVVLALLISSMLALALATTRLAFETGKIDFRDVVELRERLCFDRSVFVNFKVFVFKEKHVLEICVENGCRRITIAEARIIAPISSSPLIKPVDFRERRELFALYSNGTHAGIYTGVQLEFTDGELIITYIEPERIGSTQRLVLSRELIDDIVIYVEDATILIDGEKIAVVNGFKKIRIRKVVLSL